MAERRMFSKKVINSARFLRMPQTSRLLYYDLGMAADDDGIAEAFTVMKTTGASEDDLRVLASKGFVTILNDDLVTYITDWNVNNTIRKDRYVQSLYQGLLVKVSDSPMLVDQLATNGKPDDNQRLPQYRLGKDSIGKDRIEESLKRDKSAKRKQFSPPSLEDVKAYCVERHSSVDPVRFWEYFNAGGWVDSRGQAVKNWKQKLLTWEAHSNEKGGRKDADSTADHQNGVSEWHIHYTVDGTKI